MPDRDPSPQPFHLGYRPALDGIRGAAVLAVMLFHFGAPFDQGGFLGVDAFFVLSGFLITSLLVEEWARNAGISFRGFYLRRALRLLPALLVMLLGAGAVAATIAPPEMREGTWRGIAVTLLYVANWQKVFSDQSVGVLGHTWSLSIEEQFYILWPPLLCLLLRRRLSLRWLTAIAAALAVTSAATRAVLMLRGAATTEVLYN
ncbi:MAG TPA: acyltransferase, partial [Chloroflexota bacterium]|nr:acyltransferase [Chloroflexota bacterium]